MLHDGLKLRLPNTGMAVTIDIGDNADVHPRNKQEVGRRLAAIAGETLLVHADEVAEPVAVRYAWRNGPVANLHNAAGLPARPFRSNVQ